MQEPDTVLFDYFSVEFRSTPENANFPYLSVIPSTRGSAAKLKMANIDINNDSVAVAKDTLIFNNRFQKVYSNKRNPKLLYTEKYGIVAFFFQNDWWYLKI
jgi:hypothetical protein